MTSLYLELAHRHSDIKEYAHVPLLVGLRV
jgi:hypothetical protein